MTENSAEIETAKSTAKKPRRAASRSGHEIEEDKKKKGSEKVFARRWGDYWNAALSTGPTLPGCSV